MKNFAFIILFIVLTSLDVEARPLRELYTSVRALGMGNAYTALVDNTDSLFYNPAGLSKVEGFNWTIIDPSIGLNGLQAVEAFGSFSSAPSFADFLEGIYGDNYWVHTGVKTAVAIPGLAFGVIGAGDVSAQLSNPSYPSFALDAVIDYGATVGMALPIIPKLMSAGINLRRTTRIGATMDIGTAALSSLDADAISSQLQRKGTGYGLDFGLNITGIGPIKPTFSFVWKNVGVTTFTHDGGPAAPSSDRDEMSLGAGLTLDAFLVQVSPTFDFRYINRTDIQIGRKIHLGLEVALPLIDVRAGISEGYYTLGAGIGLGFIRMDLASYGVELGEYPGQREDRRYMFQLTLDMSFNPGVGFLRGIDSGNDGSAKANRTRLKQRR